jgi:hypothetical protein
MQGNTLQLSTQFRRPEQTDSFGARLILIVSVVVTVSCGIGYIMQMNEATSKGYEIKKLEKSVVQLRAENAKLDISAAELQSMAAKEEKINMMGMVDVGAVEYMVPPGPVAIAK